MKEILEYSAQVIQSEIPRTISLAFGKVPQSLEHEPVTPEPNMIIINTDEQF